LSWKCTGGTIIGAIIQTRSRGIPNADLEMLNDAFDLNTEHRIYLEGLRLFNEGLFFEAHEKWEEAWSQVRDRRREQFYRAIIQGAVTLELLRRGRAVGVRQVFTSCLQLFEGLPPVFMGVEIPRFIESLRHAIAPTLADLHAMHVPIEPERLFTIELVYDPFVTPMNGETVGA
jgi:predicted metal-dependent hydrolase